MVQKFSIYIDDMVSLLHDMVTDNEIRISDYTIVRREDGWFYPIGGENGFFYDNARSLLRDISEGVVGTRCFAISSSMTEE